jgi:PAS domain S-box-containing protein
MWEGTGSIQSGSCEVLESSFDGIYITDGEGNTLYANHSYENITGLKRREVLGKNMRDLVERKVIDRSGTLLALKSHAPVTLEQKFRTGKRAIITSTPTYSAAGQVMMVVTNVRDITELHDLRKELAEEKELTQKQLLELELVRKQMVDWDTAFTTAPAMLKDLLAATRVARVESAVLLCGETGVGKERIAAYIHRNSPRKNERFIKINCGSIAEQLAESELFGYEGGAFTGANARGKPGLFEVADRGTLFLDEIGELSLDMQVKLLRVIQEGEILRVGSTNPRKIDVRIIAATNRNMEEMVRENRFRKDLFYRLNVFPITVPPLRDRPDDILPLSRAILREFNKHFGLGKEFTQAAEYDLQNYSWPGNIRELRNVIERAIIMSSDDEIYPHDLTIYRYPPQNVPVKVLKTGPVALRTVLDKVESEYIEAAWTMHNNVRRAADWLSLDPATFLRKLKKYRN